MDGFEVFEKYHSRSVKELYVTIQKRGTISLNRASFRAMGSPKYAELLFNRSKRLIGIRPANAASGRTLPVRKQGHSESYLIAGLTFAKEYDIDISVARRFIATMEGNMLTIDLNSPSTEATGPRAQSIETDTTQEELFSQLSHEAVSEGVVTKDHGDEQLHPTTEPEMTGTVAKGINDAEALTNLLASQLGLGEEQTKALFEHVLKLKN